MVQPIPLPQPRELLPPLLACLPTSFISPQPPPALLPLLSPILRQRVQLLSASSDTWLTLLCWDAERAARLPKVVENIHLEPHPVSGEVELDDVAETRYRRLDPETLHARFEIAQFGLVAIYLWNVTDATGGGNAWRLAELRSVQDKEDGSQWYGGISEADKHVGSAPTANGSSASFLSHPAQEPTPPADDEDDDAYWASYDRTPGRTPAKRSPAPPQHSSVQLPSTSELEYFARYAAEVQPAMDPHDPDEEMPEGEPSTLNGDTFTRGRQSDDAHVEQHGMEGVVKEAAEPFASAIEMSHPRPRGTSSSSRSSVQQLESMVAEKTSSSVPNDQAEVAIKQHISTEMKSLYRLARNTGISREEFERTVRNQLDCLGLLDLE